MKMHASKRIEQAVGEERQQQRRMESETRRNREKKRVQIIHYLFIMRVTFVALRNAYLTANCVFPGSFPARCAFVCVSRLIICFSIFVCVNIVIFGLISKIVSCLKFPTAESKIQLHTVSRICVHFDLFSM